MLNGGGKWLTNYGCFLNENCLLHNESSSNTNWTHWILIKSPKLSTKSDRKLQNLPLILPGKKNHQKKSFALAHPTRPLRSKFVLVLSCSTMNGVRFVVLCVGKTSSREQKGSVPFQWWIFVVVDNPPVKKNKQFNISYCTMRRGTEHGIKFVCRRIGWKGRRICFMLHRFLNWEFNQILTILNYNSCESLTVKT